MKPIGLQRLQKLRGAVELLNNEQHYQEWLAPILEKLFSAHPSIVQSDAARQEYSAQQSAHLNKVWTFVLEHVETAISKNQVMPLIQNIIRFLYLPDTLDNFFADDASVQWALMTLHPILQIKIRRTLIVNLDELLIGCESAEDFMQRAVDPHLFKILDGIIKNANKYATCRLRAQIQEPGSYSESSSFISLMDVNMRQLTYVTPFAAAEDNEYISKDEDAEGVSGNVLSNIVKMQISDTMITRLFSQRHLSSRPQWMNEGVSLSDSLVERLKKYQDYLYEKFSASGSPGTRKIEQKLAFLDEIIHKAENHKLTPETFYKISQDKPYLFASSFWMSHLLKFWQELRSALKDSIWQKAKSNTSDEWGYTITDQEIWGILKKKQEQMHPKAKHARFQVLAESSHARWNQEKRAALDYIVDKHRQSRLNARDFYYIQEHFPLFTARSFSLFKQSNTEFILKQVQDYIKELIWIDAGGEGQILQQELRQTQNKIACTPNYRRLPWVGNNT